VSPRPRVLFLATSGSGKSVELQKVVRHNVAHGVRFLVGDHMSQWARSDWPATHVRIERTQNLEKLCQLACTISPVVIVYDEIDLAVNSQRPVSEKSALYEVLHMGRNARPRGSDDVLWPHDAPVGIWACARLPGSLRPDLKYLVDRVYVGRTQGKKNLRFVADMLDDETIMATRPPPERDLRNFAKGQWIYKDLT
jgi:hypothetical protein